MADKIPPKTEYSVAGYIGVYIINYKKTHYSK